jgi:hypothetical protein
MRLDTPFDVASLPKSDKSYDLIPDGWYPASVKNAEIKQTKSGGQMIALRYDIMGDKHAGRVVFGNINIRNANPEAERIGHEQLGEMVRAIGITGKVHDTDQLIGGQLLIKVGTRKSEQYGDSNEVKGFKALNNTPVPSVSTAPAPSGGAVPPWAARK